MPSPLDAPFNLSPRRIFRPHLQKPRRTAALCTLQKRHERLRFPAFPTEVSGEYDAAHRLPRASSESSALIRPTRGVHRAISGLEAKT